VRYDEITQMITESTADDWKVLTGPTFVHRLGNVRTGGQNWLEAHSYDYIAVYKPDVDLRLAWGLPYGDNVTYPGWDFPAPGTNRLLADGFWRGALVARWQVLSVDGNRCYLPHPDLIVAETGALPHDPVVPAGTTVKTSDIALARLLQQMAPRNATRGFDDYLKETGAQEIP
jgi:hypothetical protein